MICRKLGGAESRALFSRILLDISVVRIVHQERLYTYTDKDKYLSEILLQKKDNLGYTLLD